MPSALILCTTAAQSFVTMTAESGVLGAGSRMHWSDQEAGVLQPVWKPQSMAQLVSEDKASFLAELKAWAMVHSACLPI